MDPSVHLVVILVCFALSAFFSGSETALLRLRAQEVERDVRALHGPAALAARELLSSTSRLLVTILLGNNVVNILAASLAASLAVLYLGEAMGIAVSTVAITLIILVFGEILPKAFAARHPRRIAYLVALPLYLLHRALRPVHMISDRVIEPLLRPGGAPGDAEPMTSAEEILRFARETAGVRPGGSAMGIISGAARAAEMTVSEIMVPRAEVVAFPVETPPGELLERMLEERYTRVPIYEGSIDRILGIVHLKDLVPLARGEAADVRGILKPVLRVPMRKPILPLLADMERAFAHLAIVKDEFGVTQGMVTQEDILEEIVGEIRDEFDREELLAVRRLADGSVQALGRVKVIDFNRETGWSLDAPPGDTLGGLVFNALGRAPRRGEVARLPGFELEAIDVSGTRIAEVRVRRVDDEVGETATGEAHDA